MKFYGRKTELEKLNRFLARDNQLLTLIYGRRRVGKSELIKEVLRNTVLPSLYYECKQTTEMNNVESLANLISETYHFPQLAFRNIEELLDFLFANAKEQGLILVLDEYSYLRETVKGLDSIIQSLVDKYREASKLKLILCGSVVDTMKGLILKENPLYGRIDLTIDLKPMDYYDAALFYPNFSDDDKVRLYSVFGGIPYFNKLIDEKLSVRENIIELIASPGARLENEVSMYLKSEIAKINSANEVFETIAKGYHKYSDILSQSHVSSAPTMVDVLDKLIHMEIVVKQAPINDMQNKRKSSYHICDNLSHFYYKYIYCYNSQMNVMNPNVFYDRYIATDFETSYVPLVFETICQQYLIRQNKIGLLKEPFDLIGKYYYDDPQTKTNGEFDIVTKDSNGYIFYEAKFRTFPLTRETITSEIMQVEKTGFKCYKYGFISRSGFSTQPQEKEIFIDLAQIYQ